MEPEGGGGGGEGEKVSNYMFLHKNTLHLQGAGYCVFIILYNIEFSIQIGKCLLFFVYFCLLLNYRTTLLNISLTVK